jgi:pyruvate dehydrogenase E1 component
VALPAIAYYEARFRARSQWILLGALRALLDRERGESLYLRLSTKPVDQSLAPTPSPEYRRAVLKGGYRLIDARGEPGWDPEENAVHLFAAGVMVPEAVEAGRALSAEGVRASVFVVTSPDRLYRGLREPHPYLEELVTAEEEGVPVVSVLDGHSHGLAFLGSALGVPSWRSADHWPVSSRRDLYAHHGIVPAAGESPAAATTW